MDLIILKSFFLFGCEGEKNLEESFSFQTRCLTSLYEKSFEKFHTKDCKRVNFHCDKKFKEKNVELIDGFYDITVPYNTEAFLNLNDVEKKIETLELLQSNLLAVCREKEWETGPFIAAYDKVKELEYRNEYLYTKKTDKEKKFTAKVYCNHDLYEFTIQLYIYDKDGNFIKGKKLVTKPDELIFKFHLGELKWISSNQVVLTQSYAKGGMSLDF